MGCQEGKEWVLSLQVVSWKRGKRCIWDSADIATSNHVSFLKLPLESSPLLGGHMLGAQEPRVAGWCLLSVAVQTQSIRITAESLVDRNET